jgi:predicted glycosyltransferase
VVVRTPPEVSLYHRFSSELFPRVLAHLERAAADGVQTVVLPRTSEQREALRDRDLVVPDHAVDAQSLIAFAAAVVSGGGTMNREAVALGTPVWTTFAGRPGAVDERLIAEGRLRRLEDPDLLVLGGESAAARPERVRRDPGVLVDLLSAPQIAARSEKDTAAVAQKGART